MLDHTCHIKRTAVNNDNIGVFSFFQRTDTVSDADVLSRVDGYGAERVIFVHSGFDGEPCAERQVVERSYRRVCDDGDMTSGFCENARCLPGLILELKFGGMSEGRTYREREIFLCEFIHDHMALCHVLQSQADTEFFRDTDRGEDIVCLMGMGF